MKNSIAILVGLFLFSPFLHAQLDTSQVIYAWRLDPYNITKLPQSLDTNLAGFHLDNPVFKTWFSASSLGNLGSPAISNIFTDRDVTEEYTLINAFYPYMKRISNTTYVNTRKPFSKLIYINGGSTFNKEEILDAYHTQNVSPALNIGLHFTTQNSKGQYRLQQTKENSFRMFSSYSGKKYSCHLSFNMNRISADDNGGVLSDDFITDTTYSFTKEIPTLFDGVDQTNKHIPDVYREIRNISFFTIQEASFRKLFSSSDTAKKPARIKMFYPKLAYIFSIDRTASLYVDKKPATGFEAGLYPDVYVDKSLTRDSLFHWRMQNAFRLQFQGRKNNHYFADIGYDIINYSQFVPSDTVVQYRFFYKDFSIPATSRQAQLNNTHLSSGFSRIFANALKLNLYGRFYLAGYQAGDFQLRGDIELMLPKNKQSFRLKAGASNELVKPSFLYSKFISNHFIWDQSPKQTSIFHLTGSLNLSSKNLTVAGDYYLFHNLMYFDTAGYPQQVSRGLSALCIVAQQEFRLWKWHSINKAAFQQVSEPEIISLPTLALNSSNYLAHEFYFRSTEGRLLTMIGFDLYYNTRYYAYAYMPPLAAFHQQNEKQLGNYPYIDVFLNVNLKRVRFFLKYEHVNSGWLEKNFFTVLHYPKNQRYLKMGISWTFYD
jgi:hypothetical protein